MIRASSVYDRCGDLFARYPLAVRDEGWIRSVHSMVLALPGDDGARFFVLVRDSSDEQPVYSFVPWRRGGPAVTITPGRHGLPHAVAGAVAGGTPVPRHGSLFGWLDGTTVSALITVYADHDPGYPEPSWAVLPRAGAPARTWPPFTAQTLLGPWFWDYYRAARIVCLAGLIAARPETVFWADTEALLGWDCCVVARDLACDTGYVLPRGCYLYYEGLQTGQAAPSVDTLLTEAATTDLAPRLRPLTGAVTARRGGRESRREG
jgi:hypothetical protein